jgi:hypothetical protein
MRLSFIIDVPTLRIGIGASRAQARFYPLALGLEYLTNINEWHLSRKRYPPLYRSGVVYHTEPFGEEDWCDIPTCLEKGWGDCEDLGCWRAAELRNSGIRAMPDFKHKVIAGITVIHILVKWPDGRIEDPSKVLGMKGEYQ